MDELKRAAARVKGMRTIETEVRAALKQCGIELRSKELGWNRNRPYDAVPDTLELSIQARGAPWILQEFTRLEVEQCARGVCDSAIATKIQAMIEQLQELDGRRRND